MELTNLLYTLMIIISHVVPVSWEGVNTQKQPQHMWPRVRESKIVWDSEFLALYWIRNSCSLLGSSGCKKERAREQETRVSSSRAPVLSWACYAGYDSWMPDSLSCIPVSKAEDSQFHSKNLQDSRIQILLHEAIYVQARENELVVQNIRLLYCKT